MKALVTSGGKGTRLRPITHTQNKHLIPIANKPILFYALDYIGKTDIKEVGIVTHKDGGEVRDAIGDGKKWGLNITYIPQDAPLGLAHVVKISQDFIGKEPFVFYLGDNIVIGGIKKFIEEFKRAGSNCHLVLAKVKDPERFGVPEILNNRIVRVEEKPRIPKSQYAVSGIYIYDHHIFEAVNSISPSARGELEISDAHQYLIDHGYHISFSEITGWWKDTGKPMDLLEANRLVLDYISTSIRGEVDKKSYVVGKVIIEEGSRLINSNIRGPAIIGKNTIIKDSYIGPYTSIHNNCEIVKSEVEFSIILEECKVLNVGIRIEGSLLGKDVQVVAAEPKPRTHRFIIGDQSRVEVV
ncbi:MAG: glucose-1-phosphate thymidylyltransferase [Fidelibacterota bacterium]